MALGHAKHVRTCHPAKLFFSTTRDRARKPLTPRSHGPPWECRLGRSASSACEGQTTRSVGDGIPTEDRYALPTSRKSLAIRRLRKGAVARAGCHNWRTLKHLRRSPLLDTGPDPHLWVMHSGGPWERGGFLVRWRVVAFFRFPGTAGTPPPVPGLGEAVSPEECRSLPRISAQRSVRRASASPKRSSLTSIRSMIERYMLQSLRLSSPLSA
ncbi:hypothetical protein SAMN05444166_5413 [Singulisphaera sp. GP187]|nr:hypothetical protein SAMN05444166_5413 [Singulisphaera sp. GP187]